MTMPPGLTFFPFIRSLPSAVPSGGRSRRPPSRGADEFDEDAGAEAGIVRDEDMDGAPKQGLGAGCPAGVAAIGSAHVRVGVLASGSGTNLRAILEHGVPVVVVVADRPCAALDVARVAGVAAELVERDDYG